MLFLVLRWYTVGLPFLEKKNNSGLNKCISLMWLLWIETSCTCRKGSFRKGLSDVGLCRCLAGLFKLIFCLGNLYKAYVRLSSWNKTPIVINSYNYIRKPALCMRWTSLSYIITCWHRPYRDKGSLRNRWAVRRILRNWHIVVTGSRCGEHGCFWRGHMKSSLFQCLCAYMWVTGVPTNPPTVK